MNIKQAVICLQTCS